MCAVRAYTTIQKYGVGTIIQQVCINLNLKSDIECIYTGI